MTDIEARELLPLYALNALESDEAAQVEAFVARDPSARAELRSFLETSALLARSVPQLEPGRDLRARVLENIRAAPQPTRTSDSSISSLPTSGQPTSGQPTSGQPTSGQPTSGQPTSGQPISTERVPILMPSPQPTKWFIPALSALALAASLVAVVLGTRVSSLNAELAAIRTQNASGIAVVAAPGAKMYALFDPTSKKPIGQVVLTKDGRVFFAHELGQTPSGKTWQAWAITKDSKAVSLGVFTGSSVTRAVPIDVAAFGVSEEPAGGSSQPSQVRGLASL
jgi:anti-sigma-K factor RskA